MSDRLHTQCQKQKVRISSVGISVGLTRCNVTSTTRTAVTFTGINEMSNSFEADGKLDTHANNSGVPSAS